MQRNCEQGKFPLHPGAYVVLSFSDALAGVDAALRSASWGRENERGGFSHGAAPFACRVSAVPRGRRMAADMAHLTHIYTHTYTPSANDAVAAGSRPRASWAAVSILVACAIALAAVLLAFRIHAGAGRGWAPRHRRRRGGVGLRGSVRARGGGRSKQAQGARGLAILARGSLLPKAEGSFFMPKRCFRAPRAPPCVPPPR